MECCGVTRNGRLYSPNDVVVQFLRVHLQEQLVSRADVYILAYLKQGGARRGSADEMAVQIAPFPGVSRPLAYSPEALSITWVLEDLFASLRG
jgi:hypothetical protein